MIQIFHNNSKIVEIYKDDLSLDIPSHINISESIIELANKYPTEFLFWCHEDLKSNINFENIANLCTSNYELVSFTISKDNYLTKFIGFVEQSIFIKFSKEVRIATWQMSSHVGIGHANIFLSLGQVVKPNKDFDYYLNSLSKIAMPLGVFCYSDPNFLINKENNTKFNYTNDLSKLFKFVSQHYKKIWLFVLFFCLIYKERKFPIIKLIQSLFCKKITANKVEFQPYKKIEKIKHELNKDVDVLIPTIGRKLPLYNFLKNLSNQTILPKNVIIVEQKAEKNSESDLDYLLNEKWPFIIKHQLIYQLGACNARNLALNEITSSWVFFADDDIEIKDDFIEKCLEKAQIYNHKAFTLSCLLKNERKYFINDFQWVSFGSGASFVHKTAINNLYFDSKFEFGFGEDADFGMQIRNQGNDIIYLATPEIIHLKAPIGGFRTKVNRKWDNDDIEPKPSPTVMVYKLLYDSDEQLFAYKLMYFFRNFNFKKLQNPISLYKKMVSKWRRSEYWAYKLLNQN